MRLLFGVDALLTGPRAVNNTGLNLFNDRLDFDGCSAWQKLDGDY